jgi:hypothetical protein
MDNYRVHFCYLDGVNALIGRYRWRYEVVDRIEMYHQIVSLSKRGMTDFKFRRINSLDEWVNVLPEVAAAIILSERAAQITSERELNRIKHAARRAISGGR